MLETFLQYIFLILAIVMLVMLSQKLKVAYPIVLVIAGLALSLIPGIPKMRINPEMIFLVFLPPLLYEAAWFTSWKDLWRFRRIISSFAFLIVIVTSFVIAIVSSTFIPGFTMALGFLLGGIVSPPDAVSASAILKTVKAPKTLSVVLEGESLLNDASSLVVFRFALIAIDTGRFVLGEAALSFVVVIAMGILTGIIIGMIYFAIHRWLPTTPNIDIVLTLTAPYVMYIVAEHFHYSGVLSVVCGGLFLSARSHLFLSSGSRLKGGNVWSMLGFVLNGLVFMLIGLELPVIIGELGNISVRAAVGYGLLITGVLIITRIISALGAAGFTIIASRFIQTADRNPGWRMPLAFGWAGMRGVVSLAAALSVPVLLSDGSAFPQRSLILFITFTVILLTLVIQGLTLPFMIRWLKIEDNDHHIRETEQQKMIRKRLAEHSSKLIDEEHGELLKTNKALQALRNKYHLHHTETDVKDMDEDDEFRKTYFRLLSRQRSFLLALKKDPEVDESVIRSFEDLLDLEEEKYRLMIVSRT